MKFGEFIKQERNSRGITMKALSDASGVTVRTIHYVETERSYPNYYTMNVICKALGVSYVINEDAEKAPTS